eukprot:12214-Heterococcus_DN1.PRE.3
MITITTAHYLQYFGFATVHCKITTAAVQSVTQHHVTLIICKMLASYVVWSHHARSQVVLSAIACCSGVEAIRYVMHTTAHCYQSRTLHTD